MRTTTTAQDVVLASKYRSVHIKVSFKPVGGAFVDITDLESYNWLVGVEYGGQIDNYFQDAVISLHPGRGKLRLETLMTTSKFNSTYGGTYGALIDAGAQVKIETATISPNTTPVTADYITAFEGYVDSVSFESNPIRVNCRDNGSLLDRFIEAEAVYPNNNKTEIEVETLIQQILDDTYGASVIDLYSDNGTAGTPWNTSDSPDWIIKSYIQSKQTVQQALLVLANQIGWQLGYKYNDDSSAFQLHLYDPGAAIRARGTITHSGQPSATQGVTVNATTYSEPGDWAIGSTVLATAVNIAAAISVTSGVTAWALDAEKAIGTMTFTGDPSALDSFVIGSTTFTENTDWSRTVGDTTATTESIVAAINDSDEDVVANRSGSSRVVVQYQTKGTAGNSVTFTESMSNCTFDGSGTLGGSQLGKDVRTVVEWDTAGTAGNSIVFTETLSNATADGSGTLGGTVAGSDVSVDYTFGPSAYKAIKTLAINRVDVRNVVKVTWGTDADNQNSITVSDADSIAKYGRRYCEIANGASSQIDTESEVRAFANKVLDALKEVNLTFDSDVPYFWPVETGDYLTFSANGVNHDVDQSVAVIGFRHSLSVDGKATTNLRCGGKPRGGQKRWLRLEARAGVAEQNRDFQANPPVVTSIAPGMASLEINVLAPSEIRPSLKSWTGVRVYLSTSSGFTPGADNLYKEVGKQTRMVLTGLTPGETYYVRVAFLGKQRFFGNSFEIESAYSPEIGAQTQYSSPYHRNPENMFETFTRNEGFGAQTIPDSPPDAYSVASGVDASWDDGIYVDANNSASGNTSIAVSNEITGSSYIGGLVSDLSPIPGSESYTISMLHKVVFDTSDAFSQIYMIAKYYDKDKALISSTTFTSTFLSALTTDTWAAYNQSTTTPATCRYISLTYIVAYSTLTDADTIWYVDRIRGTW